MDTMHVTDQNHSTRGKPTELVAAQVRLAARANLLTQTALACALGCSRMTASRKWRGLTPWTVAELHQLAPLLGYGSVSELLSGVAA